METQCPLCTVVKLIKRSFEATKIAQMIFGLRIARGIVSGGIAVTLPVELEEKEGNGVEWAMLFLNHKRLFLSSSLYSLPSLALAQDTSLTCFCTAVLKSFFDIRIKNIPFYMQRVDVSVLAARLPWDSQWRLYAQIEAFILQWTMLWAWMYLRLFIVQRNFRTVSGFLCGALA